MADATAPSTRRDRRPRPARRVSIVGVLGEILITVGVVALLYVAWYGWIGDAIISNQQRAEAAALAEQWARESDPVETAPPSPSPEDSAEASDAAIPVLAEQDHGTIFGIMHVPRFGDEWQFNIASGVTRRDILDQGEIGHYPSTAMPGAVGNTAYAAHRWTSGAPFDPIDRLVIGDAIVIETPEGWYTYRFRSSEYVQDTQVEVLLPVPQEVGVEADGRYLTLTSCAPKLNSLERIIAYAVFDEFTPRADGPPASLTGEAVA